MCTTTLPLPTVIFLLTSHNCVPQPNIFCLYLGMVFNVVAWALWGVPQFFWVSPVYTGGIYVIKFLFVFLLLMSFIVGVSVKNLEG